MEENENKSNKYIETCLCGNEVVFEGGCYGEGICNKCGLEYTYDEGVRLNLTDEDEKAILDRRLNETIAEKITINSKDCWLNADQEIFEEV